MQHVQRALKPELIARVLTLASSESGSFSKLCGKSLGGGKHQLSSLLLVSHNCYYCCALHGHCQDLKRRDGQIHEGKLRALRRDGGGFCNSSASSVWVPLVSQEIVGNSSGVFALLSTHLSPCKILHATAKIKCRRNWHAGPHPPSKEGPLRNMQCQHSTCR